MQSARKLCMRMVNRDYFQVISQDSRTVFVFQFVGRGQAIIYSTSGVKVDSGYNRGSLLEESWQQHNYLRNRGICPLCIVVKKQYFRYFDPLQLRNRTSHQRYNLDNILFHNRVFVQI